MDTTAKKNLKSNMKILLEIKAWDSGLFLGPLFDFVGRFLCSWIWEEFPGRVTVIVEVFVIGGFGTTDDYRKFVGKNGVYVGATEYL